MLELEGQDVMIELQSMEFYLFPVLAAGGQKCPKNTTLNCTYHIAKLATKRNLEKDSIRINQDCPQTRQTEFAKNTS